MASFNQKAVNYRAQTGNQVAVFIGGVAIAFAQTVAHSIDFGSQSYYGVGSAMPQEVQQLKVQPQITITAFALTQHGLDASGQSGGLASFLANNQFNFLIVDREGNHLFTYVGGVSQNFSESIPTNQAITDTLTFLCLDVLDTSGQSILNFGNVLGVNANAGSGGAGSSGNNLGISVNSDGSGSISGGVNVGGFSVSGGGSF